VKAETKERVAWTHTVNLAHDELDSAVNEMLWSFRAADQLKRAAGVGTGGSKLEKPVLHFSLSWPHGASPDQDHMIATVRSYMEHMGWSDRQAVLIAHRDRQHDHVHVVMNSVNPLDGRAIRSSNNWRRTEAFALAYERETGQIHCEQRLKARDDREPTPTREQWQRFKKSDADFTRDETERLVRAPGYFERHDSKSWKEHEREALKAYQRKQREEFFMQGKAAYRAARNEALRDVREAYRQRWSSFYAAARSGQDKASLASLKLAIVHAQNAALDERRKLACDGLRKQRDQEYETVLSQQRFDRSELGRRQQQGLRTYALLDLYSPAPLDAAATPRREAEVPGLSWRAGAVGQPEAAREFAQSARSVIHPGGHPSELSTIAPGVLYRAEPMRAATDSVGREQANPDTPRKANMRDDAQRTDAPTLRGDGAARPAGEKAREMNDQAKAKSERTEAAALRASWNRHGRWRGGRD
jgi:hypothetical protein